MYMNKVGLCRAYRWRQLFRRPSHPSSMTSAVENPKPLDSDARWAVGLISQLIIQRIQW